jgi:iron complex outermembrane receptor protein
LYGQNAPGGAYNITTRAPNTTALEGYLEASYGQQNSADLESVDLRGAINLPLIKDTLGLRIAGVYADSDGYVKVKNPANPEDSSGGKEHQSLRSRMVWNINEDMDLLWTVNYQDLRDNGLDFNPEGFVPGTGGDNPTPATTNRFEDRDYYADFNSEAETDLVDTALHLKWAHSLTNIDILLSWQDFKTFNLDNRTPYPGFDNSFAIQLDWETKTVELRFSDTGDRLDYIAGVYYAKRDIEGFFDVDLTGVNLLGPAEGAGDINAVFANLTFHLSDKWDLTTGARYDKNEIWTISNFEFLGLNSTVDDEASFDHVSWSIKLRHFISENHTAYLAIDNAYKQGGFNNLVPGLLPLAGLFPEIAAAGEEMIMFDEETSTSFEIGIKGSAADGRLNYSLAVFYQEFKDHQIAQPAAVEALKTPLGDLNALFSAQLTNAEEVLTKGVELELVYLLGDNWDTSLRLGYFDATIEDWQFRFCGEGEEDSPDQIFCPLDGGEALNSLPKWNSNFQLGHLSQLTETLMFYGRFNWTWQSSANNPRRIKNFSDPKNIFGLSLGLQSTITGLDLRLWGKNLTDEDLNIDPGIRTDGDPSLAQPFTGRYHPGREYGLTLSYAF